MQVKLHIPEEKKKGIVNQVLCNDCDGVYTGESKRTLKVRLTEHKRAVVGSDVNNGIPGMWPRMNTILFGETQE